MPPAGGRQEGRKKNPLWALLTSCTSRKSGQTPGEKTIQDGPAPAKTSSSRKKGRNKRKKQKAQDADTVSDGSWNTIEGTTGSEHPVEVHVGSQHAPLTSGSSVDPVPGDLGNGIHTRGAKLEASPLLRSRRCKQIDAGVQTEEDGSSDEKENRIPNGQRAKRKTKLSPRSQQKYYKQESDDEEYASDRSDRSDGRSSPKRRRRRKYSDVIRVERIFIEKSINTKEEITIDKLRKRKTKSKENLNEDIDNPLEISNYDSESEVPLNRSHRIASMLSLNRDGNKSGTEGDTNASGSSSEDKGTNTDPRKLPTRLILQHVHYNTFETSATEKVSMLPPTKTFERIYGEKTAPVLTSVGPEGTSVDISDPAKVGVIPTDHARVHLDKTEIEEQKALNTENKQVSPNSSLTSPLDPAFVYDAKISENPVHSLQDKKQTLSQEQIFVADSIPQESFQDEVSYAKLERSPTLERKAIIQDTSSDPINVATINKYPTLERKADILNSNIATETVLQYGNDIQGPSQMVQVEIVPESATQKTSSECLPDDTGKSTQVAVVSPVSPAQKKLNATSAYEDATGIFVGAESSLDTGDSTTNRPVLFNSSVQTNNVRDFSPAVICSVESALDHEQSKLYEVALPGTVHVVPGDVQTSPHIIAGMRTHEPTVMKAGKSEVTAPQARSVMDQSTLTDQAKETSLQEKPKLKLSKNQSSTLNADIDGYDTFKADLHARAGIMESSSIEDLTDGLNSSPPGVVKTEHKIHESQHPTMTTQPAAADHSQANNYPSSQKDMPSSGKSAKQKVFTKKRKKKSRRAISDPLGGRVLSRTAPELPVFIPKIFTESIPSEEQEVRVDLVKTEEERYPKYMAGVDASSRVPPQLTIDDLDRRHSGRRREPLGAESKQSKQVKCEGKKEITPSTYTISEMRVKEATEEQIPEFERHLESEDPRTATAQPSVIPSAEAMRPVQNKVYQHENSLSTLVNGTVGINVIPENTEFTSASYGTSEKILVGTAAENVSVSVKVQTSDSSTQSDSNMFIDKQATVSETKTTQTTHAEPTDLSTEDFIFQPYVSEHHDKLQVGQPIKAKTGTSAIRDSHSVGKTETVSTSKDEKIAQEVSKPSSTSDQSSSLEGKKLSVVTKATQIQREETSDSGNNTEYLVTEPNNAQTPGVELTDSAQQRIKCTKSETKTTQTPVVTLSDASTDGSLDSLDRYAVHTEGKTTQTSLVYVSEISNKEDVTTDAKMTQTKRVDFSDAATESLPELEYTSGPDDSAYHSARDSTLEDKGSQTVSQSDDTDEEVSSHLGGAVISGALHTAAHKSSTYVPYQNIDVETPMAKWYLTGEDSGDNKQNKVISTETSGVPITTSGKITGVTCQVGCVAIGQDAVTETPPPLTTKEEIDVEEIEEIEIMNAAAGKLPKDSVKEEKLIKPRVAKSENNTQTVLNNVRRTLKLQVTKLAPIDIEPDEAHRIKHTEIQRDGSNEDTLDDISLMSDRADSGYYQLQSSEFEHPELPRDTKVPSLPTRSTVQVTPRSNQEMVHIFQEPSAEVILPLSVNVTTSQLDQVRAVEFESSQMSPMSVNSDRLTSSTSSREFSPENDNPSEDDYPLSPLPLDERPERRMPEGESPSYKKVRVSTAEAGDLELASDKLPTVVESFAEVDQKEDWHGSFSQRIDRHEIRERRQGVTTYSGDYSSNDDVIKPVIEEQQKKSITITRTDSGSPKQRRRGSPMRSRKPQRRYVVSSDDYSESDSEGEQAGLDEYGDHLTVTQFRERTGPVGKSPNTPMTPSRRSVEGVEDQESTSAPSGKYRWSHHGQQDGAFHGDTEPWRHHTYTKETRLDHSHSEYGSMGDDTASTDDSVLDRSDDQMLDKQLSYLNDAQLAWNVPPRTPSGQPLTPRMVFTTDDGTQIVVRSPPDGALSPANIKSPRAALTPKDREEMLKEIPYEKLDTLVQKVLMAYVDRCAFLESKLFELQKDRDGLNSDNQSLHESWMEMRRRMSLMEIEIEIMRKELVYHSAWRTTITFHPRHIGNHPCISARHTRLFPRI